MIKGYLIPLSVDELMVKARSDTGIDIVDHDVVEPLSILHRSFCEDAQLHEQGALATQEKLLRLLRNRLRMQRDFARHPEIADEKISGPLIVMGMARSGTTKTQKILAASGDFNWLPFWQTYNPALFTGLRSEPLDARIREADAYCRWFEVCSPQSKLGHPPETFEPEEDTLLSEHCFRTICFHGFAEVSNYMKWMATQSPMRNFEFLRDVLKYLQWQGLATASKPWLLKSPAYFGLESSLFAVFPDARLVMTHREPTNTIPSSCKLVGQYRQPFGDAPVDPQAMIGGLAALMNVHLDFRETSLAAAILDLSFREIAHSADGAVERIYRHAGLELSREARERMARWDVDHPAHKNGKFEYSLAEFGLDATQIESKMARYLEFARSIN